MHLRDQGKRIKHKLNKELKNKERLLSDWDIWTTKYEGQNPWQRCQKKLVNSLASVPRVEFTETCKKFKIEDKER